MNERNVTACFVVIALALATWSCGTGTVTASVNERAALTGNLPRNPLQWKVITSSIDKQTSTMSTLYGNDVAVRYARGDSKNDYPPGSVLSLVTWAEQDDSHWFGARIPAEVKSVEFVSVITGAGEQAAYSYENYEGAPLRMASSSMGRPPGSRAAYLLSQRAAVMP